MDHNEAVNLMAAERYLLGELPPEARDAFEEHFFDCPECAFDMRAGTAFWEEARVLLPQLVGAASGSPRPVLAPEAELPRPDAAVLKAKRKFWAGWWRPLFSTPAFAAPVFAALLAVVGYQNLVTFPALRVAASEPRLLPSETVHIGTRRGARIVVAAGRKSGALLEIDVPNQLPYAAYEFDLYDPQGKLAWTHRLAVHSNGSEGTDEQTLSLALPGAGLKDGTYALAIEGLSGAAQRTEVERDRFDIQLHD